MQGGMCTNPLDARNLLLSSQLLDSREKTVSALDAIAGVTPVMVQAGIHAFRRWEERFNHPDEAYPFYDQELREAVTAVFLAMSEIAHSFA